MKSSRLENLITDFPVSLEPGNNHQSNNSAVPVRTAHWTFKKEAGELACAVVRNLQIQKQLCGVNAQVEKLLHYSHSEQSSMHIVRAEFEAISCPLPTNWRHVNECLDGMIACFSALAEIHANNVYHGNPCIENVIFQSVKHQESGLRSTKGYLSNFRNCGYINGDPNLSAKDVQIALSDFGGRLLTLAEDTGFKKIRVLKMHLECQVNFADQDDLDELESAFAMHNHLTALKNLLNLRNSDYPQHHGPSWGPLTQEQVLKEYLELQQEKQAPTLKRPAHDEFKFRHYREVKTRESFEFPNNNPKTTAIDEFKKRFYSANTAGVAMLTAGAVISLLSMRAKQTGKK